LPLRVVGEVVDSIGGPERLMRFFVEVPFKKVVISVNLDFQYGEPKEWGRHKTLTRALAFRKMHGQKLTGV
jgi:hypothetical protein